MTYVMTSLRCLANILNKTTVVLMHSYWHLVKVKFNLLICVYIIYSHCYYNISKSINIISVEG